MDRDSKETGSDSAMTTINHLIINMHGLSSSISHSSACFCVIYLPHFHLQFVILPVHLQKLLMPPAGTLILLPVHTQCFCSLFLKVWGSWQLHPKKKKIEKIEKRERERETIYQSGLFTGESSGNIRPFLLNLILKSKTCHKYPLGLKDELVKFLQAQQGHYDLTSRAF